MKKIIIIAVLQLFILQVKAQVNPGIYQIKLIFSQKVLEDNFGNLAFNPSCANTAATSCKRQVWELKSVPNRANVYTITNISNNKLLTYTKNGSVGIGSVMNLLPIKPQAQREEQYFYIKEKINPDRTPAGYVIQPYSRANPNTVLEYYVSARESSMRWDNCPLEMFYLNGSDPEKMHYESLLFSLQMASPGVIVGPSRTMSSSVNSPSVVVTPKSDNKLDIDFKTGSDNLEPKDFMEGLKIVLKIRNKPDLVKENANEGREWPNNSIRRVTLELPADVICTDIYEIGLSRVPKGHSWNNMTAIMGDNWNLNKLTLTTRIKTNGVMKTKSMDWISPLGSSQPLFRFVYEKGEAGKSGTELIIPIGGICTEATASSISTAATSAVLTALFGTGGDNLEGGNDNNINIKIKLRSSNRIITLSNVNDSAKWGNFTENSVQKEIPNSLDLDINDIKEVEIRHTGGGGMFADNWHVDKIKISITKNGVTKVLVDKIDTPIHMFTGDSRSKRFAVE